MEKTTKITLSTWEGGTEKRTAKFEGRHLIVAGEGISIAFPKKIGRNQFLKQKALLGRLLLFNYHFSPAGIGIPLAGNVCNMGWYWKATQQHHRRLVLLASIGANAGVVANNDDRSTTLAGSLLVNFGNSFGVLSVRKIPATTKPRHPP